MNKKQEEIKKLISEMLVIMEIPAEMIEVETDSKTGNDIFQIRTAYEDALIGRDGERFSALQHLIKRIVNKDEGDKENEYKFSVDVNNHQKARIERLRNKAIILANQARDFKKNIEMEPMSSYERLVCHDALAGQNNIKTESTGVGKDRRLVIKYTEDKEESFI
ncbi:MAG: R3H domain-containing nucleic acid-binding protein [bacterium]